MRTRLDLCEVPDLARRRVLLAGGAVFGWSFLPKFAHAAGGRDPRLVTIVLRGALDGLATVAPIGDPDYERLHGSLSLSKSGATPALSLSDSYFALNPGLKSFAQLYAKGQASIVHAVATGYRERSHFDGQDVLESGQPAPGLTGSGWLNRALEALPKGEHATARGGLGVGAVMPLIMRGGARVTGWVPTQMPPADDDLALRVMDLYSHSDAALGASLSQGLDIEKIVAREKAGKKPGGGADVYMRRVAEGAARLIAASDGPRVVALAFDGWDTHANEGGATGRLAMLLGGLDGAIDAFEKGLGDAWKDTAIVVITEFGRTAHINGTTGTDHGTGTVALLAGGAIKGGKVIADWPGLKDAQLWQQRDLKPTTDLRAVLKGVLADHLGLSRATLDQRVFPESAAVAPLKGLIA